MTTKPKSVKTSSGRFSIVGLGSSAGGLEALGHFFSNMPNHSGMAFVVIQHLDPNHTDFMPELLQRNTSMKVFQATHRIKVKPNCVYVIPPNKSMTLLQGELHLFEPIEPRGQRLPVDVFFRSLAAERQEKSIGIILSGMGHDGSLGVKAIKERNGSVLVQNPASAKFDSMPLNATKAVIADIVAHANELPGKLIAFLKMNLSLHTDSDTKRKKETELGKILIMLQEQSGHDFSFYKKNTVYRRIERRMGVHKIDKINTYVGFLQKNPGEVDMLFNELLISVSSFFRDASVWEMLKERVLPALMNELAHGYQLRAWVPGCSSGEEAYSLAIIFNEVLEKNKNYKNLSLKIFATDLGQDAIEKARSGVFPSNIAADVSPERLNRFFTVVHQGYSVNPAIREMIVFAKHNVITDPPFTRLDLLTCRNLLIYMEPELQKKILASFAYSLNPGGILVLGTSEIIENTSERFKKLDVKWNVFKLLPIIPGDERDSLPSTFYRDKTVPVDKHIPLKPLKNIQSLTDQLLFQRFPPPSVLINATGDIIYQTGNIDKYIEPVAGKANWNIHAMNCKGLHEVLPVALREAALIFDPVIKRNVKIEASGTTRFVNLTVQRIENPVMMRGMILILFTDVPALLEHRAINPKKGKRNSSPNDKELELELQRTREDLQITREEMQTSQEELLTTNEELQSVNEELITSKEEMQSLNEELLTVNAELQSKLGDFVLANDDMKNLLNSTGIATLFLDKNLNIRRFTNQATDIIKLRSKDIGRPFTDLVMDLDYPEIESHAREVLNTLTSVEKTISSRNKRWYNVRIMPYLTKHDHVNGLVITFTDVTFAKQASEAVAISETRYRRLFESSKDGILILDAETGRIVDVNPFLIEMLGYSKEQFIEKAIWEIGFLNDIIANKDKFSELQHKEFVRYENLPLETANGHKINVEFISNVYSVNKLKVIQCQIRDITQRKQAEEILRKSKEIQSR